MIKTTGSIIDPNNYLLCTNPYKGSYVAYWDFKELEDEQFEYIGEEFDYKPSLSEVKRVITQYYNNLCDEEIRSGLEFEGNQVWLSQENQINYKSAFDLNFQNVSAGKPFIPMTFKLGTDEEPVYRNFEDISDMQVFITACFTHIQNTLSKYWEIKDNIDWNKYQ